MLSIEEEYKNAYELYDREKYGAAQEEFMQVAEELKDIDSELKTRAEFYAALCGAYLFNEDSEFLLLEFIKSNPESMLTRDASWEMAMLMYRLKKYSKAAEYFKDVDAGILDSEDRAEYYFKKGYCSFVKRDYDQAGLDFYEIKDIQSDYTGPAIYYYSYIAYKQKNFQTALQGFRRLEEDVNFKEIVPYYILQILYSQEEYEEVIKTGPALLEKSIPGRSGEIARFIGDSYYQLKNYREARPYLETYVKKTKYISREDKFQMGFMYYYAEEYAEAIKYFEAVGGIKDLLGQNAHYLLADCFIKTGNKQDAAIAFYAASNMDFDKEISEDALFNYAKITYELNFSPFNETVRAFQEFIDTYPYSKKIDDAYHYLVLAYFNTRNYKYAYESLTKIQDKNSEIKEAYQRVAFFRGLELYGDLQFGEALDMFDISLQQDGYDGEIRARALYWKAETMYRQADYSAALELYNEFLLEPAAYSRQEYNIAHYNVAYSYFNLKDYGRAARWFRKYEALIKGSGSILMADTYNRLGDCAFISTDYPLAIKYYEKSIGIGSSFPDYALFQKSFSYGLGRDYFRKIEGLTVLLNDYKKSAYRDDALFERGRSYVQVEKPEKALDDFFSILELYENSSYYSKALLSIGLVYYNKGDNEKAIETYKRVVSEFQGSPESRSALTGMKTVYVDMNNVDAYFEYVHSLGSFANLRLSEMDSLTYQSGENLYMAGECERAVKVLSDYLDKFPEGSFVVNASFYRAECYSRTGKNKEALEDYKFVTGRPKNVFTEASLLVVSAINFSEGNYYDALENYIYLEHVADMAGNKLTALTGQIRCLYLLGDYAGVVSVGKRILNVEELNEEIVREVYFKLGRSYDALGSLDKAAEQYREIAGNIKNAEGAEAKYRLAKILFKQDRLEDAQKEVSEFIDMNTPHQKWMARIFILSSDISLRNKDLFQARYTLQSLIDYYDIEDDGIKQEARDKLEQILEMEKEGEPENR